MKFELEEKDLKYIDNINKDIKDGKCHPLFINQINREYYINFTCLDIAKANLFTLLMISNKPEITKIIEDTFGIRVNSINYCNGDTKLGELKAYLTNFLNNLESIDG